MITEYLDKTEDEEQRQSLLQLVEHYRSTVPNLKKDTLNADLPVFISCWYLCFNGPIYMHMLKFSKYTLKIYVLVDDLSKINCFSGE